MKTLREYIDQLDEISRRDFLKGAGVAAVAGAVGTGAYMNRGKGASGNFEGDDGIYVDQLLDVRLACKADKLFKTNQFNPDAFLMSDPATLNTTTELLKKYFQANPKMKPIVEREWELTISNATSDYQQDPAKFFENLNKAYKNKDVIIANFERFLEGQRPLGTKPKGEFDESLELDTLERIQKLVKL